MPVIQSRSVNNPTNDVGAEEGVDAFAMDAAAAATADAVVAIEEFAEYPFKVRSENSCVFKFLLESENDVKRALSLLGVDRTMVRHRGARRAKGGLYLWLFRETRAFGEFDENFGSLDTDVVEAGQDDMVRAAYHLCLGQLTAKLQVEGFDTSSSAGVSPKQNRKAFSKHLQELEVKYHATLSSRTAGTNELSYDDGASCVTGAATSSSSTSTSRSAHQPVALTDSPPSNSSSSATAGDDLQRPADKSPASFVTELRCLRVNRGRSHQSEHAQRERERTTIADVEMVRDLLSQIIEKRSVACSRWCHTWGHLPTNARREAVMALLWQRPVFAGIEGVQEQDARDIHAATKHVVEIASATQKGNTQPLQLDLVRRGRDAGTRLVRASHVWLRRHGLEPLNVRSAHLHTNVGLRVAEFRKQHKAGCDAKVVVKRFNNSESQILVVTISPVTGRVHECDIDEDTTEHRRSVAFEDEVKRQLVEGKSPRHVYRDMLSQALASLDEEETLPKDQVITMADIYSIQKKFKLSWRLAARPHEDLLLRVQADVAQARDGGEAFIHMFKPYNADLRHAATVGADLILRHGLPHDKKDFLLMMHSPMMIEELRSHGEVVAFDATHRITFEGAKLVTVLVVNRLGKGCDVMWIITMREDTDFYDGLFRYLRSLIGPNYAPKAVMADMAPAPLRSVVNVFGDSVKLLNCLWHVKKAFRENLRRFSGGRTSSTAHSAFNMLHSIMEHHDRVEVLAKVATLKAFLHAKEENDFRDWIMQHYLDDAHLPRWTMCHRLDVSYPDGRIPRTNMFVESWHNLLKTAIAGRRTCLWPGRLVMLLEEHEARHRYEMLLAKRDVGLAPAHLWRLDFGMANASIAHALNGTESSSPLNGTVSEDADVDILCRDSPSMAPSSPFDNDAGSEDDVGAGAESCSAEGIGAGQGEETRGTAASTSQISLSSALAKLKYTLEVVEQRQFMSSASTDKLVDALVEADKKIKAEMGCLGINNIVRMSERLVPSLPFETRRAHQTQRRFIGGSAPLRPLAGGRGMDWSSAESIGRSGTDKRSSDSLSQKSTIPRDQTDVGESTPCGESSSIPTLPGRASKRARRQAEAARNQLDYAAGRRHRAFIERRQVQEKIFDDAANLGLPEITFTDKLISVFQCLDGSLCLLPEVQRGGVLTALPEGTRLVRVNDVVVEDAEKFRALVHERCPVFASLQNHQSSSTSTLESRWPEGPPPRLLDELEIEAAFTFDITSREAMQMFRLIAQFQATGNLPEA